jgi:hypothetical protein
MLEQFEKLKSIARTECKKFLQTMNKFPADVDINDFDFSIWATVGEGTVTHHAAHQHAQSACSGVFYSMVPKEKSKISPIVFSDPRGQAFDGRLLDDILETNFKKRVPGVEDHTMDDMYTAKMYVENNYRSPLYNDLWEPEAPFHSKARFYPAMGQIVIFPSWLVHSVQP